MYQTINFSSFCDAFSSFTDRKDTFSYKGKRALFDYLESVEADTDDKIELDIIALCCDFVEYDSVIEAASEYAQFEVENEAMSFLQDNTTVIEVDGGGVIIQNF